MSKKMPPMDAGAILHELIHAEGLPREALKAASERSGEMVPLFLREIQEYLDATAEGRARATPLFFAFHLLGEWREESAYGPLLRLLRCRSHELDVVLGDAVTSTSHKVIAAVFDGDLAPLFDTILDHDADEYIRARMCEALAMVVLRREADQDMVARFLRDAFMTLQPQATNFVWHGWQSAIAMLGLRDLGSLVKKAFDRGFIDRDWLGYAHFKRDMEDTIREGTRASLETTSEFALFEDTVEELSSWAGFSEKDQAEREPAIWDDVPEWESDDQPFTNPFRGIGRNDPCPCGSGKKFKKCCLERVTALEDGKPF